MTAGQGELILALIESAKLKHNPLCTLRDDVYPRWHATYRKSFQPWNRRCYGEPIPDALLSLALDQLNEWALQSGFITDQGDPAAWIVDWAASQFWHRPNWPNCLLTSFSLSGSSAHNSQDGLSAPERIPIEVNATIPPGGTEAQAIELFLAKFREARDPSSISRAVTGQSGHPRTGNNARYLARALCGQNRSIIAKRFNVTENAVTKGQKRAADAAGIRFPLK